MIPASLESELLRLGVIPSKNFSEEDEAPDLSDDLFPYDQLGNDLRLDEHGEPLF